MSQPTLRLLDCTLRDGGYQTGWRFSDDLLASYLSLCAAMDLDVVEIGYLNLAESGAHSIAANGSFKNVPDSLTLAQRELLEASSLNAAVMVEARNVAAIGLTAASQAILAAISRAPLGIRIVRIAATLNQLPLAAELARLLDAAQRSPIINLMQAADLPQTQLLDELNRHLADVPLAALYFADSFGRMRPCQVRELFKTLGLAASVPLGFHAHNNLGLAVVNANAAIEGGAQYIDGTFGGIGRGAGNAATESLYHLTEGKECANAMDLCDLFLAGHIEPLRDSLRWGPSPAYRCQALSGVHPTYAQRLVERQNLTDINRIQILQKISVHKNARTFEDQTLAEFV
jgi:4-hydroxy 2-oxovalerate aldolase